MIWHYSEDIFEIVVYLEVIRKSRLDDAVDYGAGFRAVHCIDVYPVLPAEGERTDRSFGGIVIHRHIAMLQEDSEVWLLVKAVFDCAGSLPLDRAGG